MHLTLKQLLLKDGNWYHYRRYYEEADGLRSAVISSVTKIMSCKHYSRGYAHYCCENHACTHIKKVKFSCKDRSCSVCGRTATDRWIAKQKNLLPPSPFQHITFTMPSDLWCFFQTDRQLINELPRLAARALKKIAKKKGVTLGMFMAIHTFGRKLNWNVHLHVSVTRGGLTESNQWKDVYFKGETLMKMWRYALITMIRKKLANGELTIPGQHCNTNIYTLLDNQYQKFWRIHCAKPQKNPKKDIEYLGRYITRPAIANSRLKHYDGTEVLFNYLDHKTKTKRFLQLDVFDFIDRFIQHIPEKGFRMIRYFGFLSNRTRAKLLPIVSNLFNHIPKLINHSWALLVKQKLGINPLECILCKSQMRFSFLCIGLSTNQLKAHHNELALQKAIRVPLL